MDLVQIRAALGLPETADEAAILAAATTARTIVAAHSAQMAAITTAAGLSPALTVDGIVTALQTQRAGVTDVATMAATIVGLETKVATMAQAQGQRDAAAFVDGAIKAGKPVVAQRDHYIARHVKDPASVETEINALVSINAGGMPAPRQGGGGNSEAELTADDNQVIARMNLDPVAYLATKKKLATPGDGRSA